MPLRGLSIGPVRTIEDAERTIHDIETYLNSWFPEDAPLSGIVVLARNADGQVEQWTIVSAGGCTIVQDAVNRQIKISVP